MPSTPHIDKHFTSTETVRDVVIGMADGLTIPFALAAEASRILVFDSGKIVEAGTISWRRAVTLPASPERSSLRPSPSRFRLPQPETAVSRARGGS